jgi:PAS domain S-box-containing protein
MPVCQNPEDLALQEACAEIKRLQAENETLRQLNSHGVPQDQSRGYEPPLERDLLRLEAIQRFIERGVLAESLAEFGPLACESVIGLLGCGVGILVYHGGSDGIGFLFESGLGDASADALEEMNAWKEQCLGLVDTADPDAFPPLPQSLGYGEVLAQPVLDAWGKRQGWIFACNKREQNRDGFQSASQTIFKTFAKQLGVLMVSLRRHLTINEQIDTIRISEERLSTALVATNVGLWDWDLITGQIFYSDQWMRQLGLEADELSDSPDEWISRIHPDDWDHAVNVVHKCCIALESSFELTVRMRKKDGSWIWINSRGHHVASHAGTVRRMIGTQIDVTPYKTLETKLLKAERKQRLARELAERENRAKSTFLAAVSHEIRTPLNGILGVLQMLRMSREMDRNKLSKLVDMGELSAKWMLRIIGESLDIARIEAGKLELYPEVVDLDSLLEELKVVKSKRASQLGLELRWQVAADVPQRILVDGLRLRQILANLIVNALKFTNQGFVGLEVSAGPLTKDGKQRLSFAISDSGVGFSKDFGRIIFEPFIQRAESNRLGDHGIGMGLAITKELVGLMGGKIKVASQPDVGSTFTVSLPVRDMSRELIEVAPGTPSAVPAFRGQILLVEDDPISGEICRLMLGELGFQVTLVTDGKQGLEMASVVHYDLILMDCRMPVMGGIEATRQLRASAAALSRNVPIIALTGNASEADASECRAAGMNDFMTKPLMLDHLLEKLTLYLPFCPSHDPASPRT